MFADHLPRPLLPLRSHSPLSQLSPCSPQASPAVDEWTDHELVAQARAGDDIALATLLLRYSAFARQKARSFFLVGADQEDMAQEAMIGLYKAVRDFDSTMETTFHGFAELCVSRQMISAIKAANRHKHAPLNTYVSFSRPMASDEQDERCLGDFFAAATGTDPVEVLISAERIRALQEHVNEVLSDLEIEVLHLYVDGKSYIEIAEIVQRQTKVVDNALQRVKRKLDVHLRERELAH